MKEEALALLKLIERKIASASPALFQVNYQVMVSATKADSDGGRISVKMDD